MGYKRITATSAKLRKNGNMWKSLGGILVNIFPQEDQRPNTLWPWDSQGTIFTRTKDVVMYESRNV